MQPPTPACTHSTCLEYLQSPYLFVHLRIAQTCRTSQATLLSMEEVIATRNIRFSPSSTHCATSHHIIEQRNANLMIWSCVTFFRRGLPSATAFPYYPRWAFHIYLNVFVCSVVRIPDHKTNALQMCTGLKNLFHNNVSSPTHFHLLFLTAINSIGACLQL